MPSPIAVLREIWITAAQMAPYLLVGFAAAGMLSLVLTPELVRRTAGGRGWRSSLKAVLIGIPLPLCSCGVIPVTAALRKNGAGAGAAAAFLTATPQTGADSILATHALMGPWFAAFRVFAAFVSGMASGVAVDAVTRRGDGEGPASGDGRESCGCCCHGGDPPDPGDAKGAPASGEPPAPAWLRAARFGFVDLPRDIGAHLAIGLLVSGALAATIPPDVLSSINPPWYLAYVAAMAIGLPLYVCSTASIPIASAMIAAGLSPGAALIFLITGPATNAATIATAAKIIGARGAVAYLATLVASAWAMGALADALPFAPSVVAHVHDHCAALTPWHHAAATLLCAILVAAALGRVGWKRT
ncbi:MAG: permease [Verrucomicrobiae bacterium]|nr:permease [Verrucomicrobiae bacterium]